MSSEPSTVAFVGLGTLSFSTLVTGAKNIKGHITLPMLKTGAPANSPLIVSVNLNGGAPFYTSVMTVDGFETGSWAVAGSVFNVVLSSTSPLDQGLNTIESTISFY